MYYLWARNIQKVVHWIQDHITSKGDVWVQMEYASSQSHLSSLLCAQSLPI